MNGVRVYLSDCGVTMDTPVAMNPLQISLACDYALKTYKQRHKNLPPGDRRDGVEKMIRALKARRITQRVVGKTPYDVDRVLFGRA